MAAIARLAVNVVAETQRFDAGMARSRRSLKGLGDAAQKTQFRLSGLRTIAGMAGISLSFRSIISEAQRAQAALAALYAEFEKGTRRAITYSDVLTYRAGTNWKRLGDLIDRAVAAVSRFVAPKSFEEDRKLLERQAREAEQRQGLLRGQRQETERRYRAAEKETKLIEEAFRVNEEMRTPLQKFHAEWDKLDKLLQFGLGPEAYQRKLDALLDELTESDEKLQGILKRKQTWKDWGKSLTESLRTPVEEFRLQQEKINKALSMGAISAETAKRAREQALRGLHPGGGEFRQITTLGWQPPAGVAAAAGGKPQAVVDPQLAVTNKVLKSIDGKLGDSSGARAA